VDLAISILTGRERVDDYPLDRLDLNGDGRFNVADLVLLGHILVREGASVLPGAKEERIPVSLAVEPGENPGDLRLLLTLDLPFSARTGYLELLLPGPSADVAGLSMSGAGLPAPRLWHGREGNLLRVLVAPGEGGPLVPATAHPARLEIDITGVKEFGGAAGVERMIWSDEAGTLRRFRITGGAALVPSSAAALLLRPNRPNPFNPETVLHYYLPEPSFVRLRVFDLTGRAVATVVEGWEGAGWCSAAWEGNGDDGSPVVSGVYFGRLETGVGTRTVRMTLVR